MMEEPFRKMWEEKDGWIGEQRNAKRGRERSGRESKKQWDR